MSKLRAGIIGLGVGEQHIAGYHRHPNCAVTALCDHSPEKGEHARRLYPQMRFYEHDNDLLDDDQLDVVSIASYDDCHFEQVRRALQNGKHVFVEKPLCLYEREARELRALLDANPGLRLSSNLVLRRSPRFCELKKLVAEGGLGRLYYLEADYNYGRLHKITKGWRGQIEFYSVVHGGAIHMVDLIMWLTGQRIVEVRAMGNQIASAGSSFRFNDLVVGLVRFESGMLAKVTSNFGCVFPHFHGLTVYGTEGTFVNGRDQALVYTSRNGEPKPVNSAYPGAAKGDLICSFLDSILNGSPAEVTSEDVFESLSVCLAFEAASRSGHAVPVEYV